jgi:hypothetical protein
MVEAPFRTPQPSQEPQYRQEPPDMSRSFTDLVALATNPDLDPFDRMCHAATLTNQAHAATAALARTCAIRGEESLEDLGNVLAMSAEDVGRLIGWEQLRLPDID